MRKYSTFSTFHIAVDTRFPSISFTLEFCHFHSDLSEICERNLLSFFFFFFRWPFRARNASNYRRVFVPSVVSRPALAHYQNSCKVSNVCLYDRKNLFPTAHTTNDTRTKWQKEINQKSFESNENVSNGNMKTIDNVKIDEAKKMKIEKIYGHLLF